MNQKLLALTNAARESPPLADNIPEELLALRQWVCWRFDLRDGKPTKIPVNPVTLANASTADPQTWGTFDQAMEAGANHPELAGIGFVFAVNDPYLGVDIDHCFDPFLNVIEPEATDILHALNTYAEFSQSGTGIHLICKAKMPEHRGRRKGAIEFYSAGRYFCMTGKRVPAYSAVNCVDLQTEIDNLINALFPIQPKEPIPLATVESALDLSDTQLLDKARSSGNSDKFSRLWDGTITDYDDDQSRADAALLSLLRFWTSGDKYRAMYLFGQSTLGRRGKWQRPDYRESTWAAIDSGEVYHIPPPPRVNTPLKTPEIKIKSNAPETWYDADKKEYLFRNTRGVWLSLTESQFRAELKSGGMNDKPAKGQNVSDIVTMLIETRNTRDVDYSGPLAGYREGFYETGNLRLLITQSPTIIQPAPGEWNTLSALIDGLLVDPVADQRPFVYGWLKIAYETLLSGSRRPGQALAITGPHNCGKSLFQQIITTILGGRFAKPYQYMAGNTQFNHDFFGAEHLMIEDEPAHIDIRMRRTFGSNIRQITAADGQRDHPKHRTPICLYPFWRLSITLNDEPENLMILPPMDDSLEDKLIILRANKKPMPMPTLSDTQRTAFMKQMLSEIPAFLHFLTTWTIPAPLLSERYGVTHYQHPDILREIDALSPESKLLTLIDSVLFQPGGCSQWEGTANDLERVLTGKDCEMQMESRRLFSFNTACGVYLARLSRKYPSRIEKQLYHSNNRLWRIFREVPPLSSEPF